MVGVACAAGQVGLWDEASIRQLLLLLLLLGLAACCTEGCQVHDAAILCKQSLPLCVLQQDASPLIDVELVATDL
jgi:hypothetical protein